MPEVLTQVDQNDSLGKLSGRALDAAVAERVMKWFLIDRREMGWNPNGPEVWATGDEENPTYQLFTPSTSIEAAMEVVGKMREAGWCFEINCYPEDYNVSAYNSGTSGDITEEYLSNITTRTESYRCQSLAKAICLATLEASGTDAAELFDLNEANEAFRLTESEKK